MFLFVQEIIMPIQACYGCMDPIYDDVGKDLSNPIRDQTPNPVVLSKQPTPK
jgi:hypothetical protein